MSIVFEAEYESWAQTSALAKKRGWDGENDSPLSYVDPVRCSREFPTLETAVAWLKELIDDGATVFNTGDVTSFVEVPRSGRCRWCVCQGSRPVKHWTIGVTGDIEEVRDADSPCASDED